MESIVCTVKNAVLEGTKATCSVFMLSDRAELQGKNVSHFREQTKIGVWKVVSCEKDLILERVSGDQTPEMADYLTAEGMMTEPPPPSKRQIGHYLTFEGKNWKLAAEKKWREKMIDIAGYEEVGETSIKGKPYRVLKGPEMFAAVRIEPAEVT